jgi:hypothetical protein
VLGLGSEGLGVCVGKVPSQAKHSRQGSFIECVAVWGRCHLRPNMPDRGFLLSVCQCGEGAISGQTCQTGSFLRCTISGQTFQTGVFFSKCGCVGNEPSQAKHFRQGSFIECLSVWGRCHFKPNMPDRGLFCVVPSQAKHSRQGSFFLSVAAWGMNHLRPNIPDRGLLLSVWLCGEGVISSQTCRTRVFFALYHLRPNIPDRGLLLYV